MPIRKVGKDTPSKDIDITTCALSLPRRNAASIPAAAPGLPPAPPPPPAPTPASPGRAQPAVLTPAGLTQANAKLTPEPPVQQVRELHRKRAVQSGLLLQSLTLRCRRVLAQQVGDRIAHVLEQGKRHKGHGQYHGSGLAHSGEEQRPTSAVNKVQGLDGRQPNRTEPAPKQKGRLRGPRHFADANQKR